MKAGIFSLRTAASFRNQSLLLYKAAIQAGYDTEERSLVTPVKFPKENWDRLIVLCPLWPRYVFDSVRLSSPWISKRFTLYGPVDGPFTMNLTFFKIMENMKITVPSQFCKTQMESSGIKVDKIVPHAIDPKDYEFSRSTKYNRLKQLRKLYPGKTIFFSNLNPLHRKGFSHLAEAIEILSKKRKNEFVFILHTGRKKALDIHPKLDQIRDLVIEDAYNQLPFRAITLKTMSCDVVVFPTLLEGFGLPCLESMAAKKPLVCCDMAPLNEMVDYESAWLFPYNEIKEEQWAGPGCKALLHLYDPEVLAMTMEDAMDHPEEGKKKARRAHKKSKAYHYKKVYGPFVKGG